MPRRQLSEQQFVAELQGLFAQNSTRIETGIGDDAAVILPGRQRWVWTVDASFAGVHFNAKWLSYSDIGYRAAQAALSDLAAMGAAPLAMLSSLGVPQRLQRAAMRELVRGQARAAREQQCPIVGGNISRADRLSVTTTVLGEARKPLLRSGARVGDELWLIGNVGLARAGLLALQRRVTGTGVAPAVHAWRRPKALIGQGLGLIGRAHAAIDISDGLSGDARTLALASGVKIVVAAELLRAALSPQLLGAAKTLKQDAWQLALVGGDDYALLACGRANKRPNSARHIGYVERGSGAVLRTSAGDRALKAGFDHLA
ncbi:MAG TPA: thiamine-phosphate kinase [Polyangiaceae bacterium]|nr:thiamine-phosphate kinase [Polyangiaceae bacterium]